MLWLAAFGYIGNKVEKQEAMRRQIDVNKLIMDKGGIQINVDGDVYLCDITMYKAFNDQAWDSRDLINATLLASAKYSQNPPELKSLMVNNAFVKSQMQIIIAIIFVFVGLLISLPYLLWQDPLRILLLRPFDQRNVTRSLKKFICRNLSGWGHVLTLTDRHINESYFKNSTRFFSPRRLIYEVLIFFLFPLVRLPGILIIVRKEKHLARLAAALNNRYNLNCFSLSDIIRKVRSTDALWQRVALFLISNTDLIIIDITVVKEGTIWEVERIVSNGLLSKCLLIAEQGKDNGLAVLMPIVGTMSRPVFFYEKGGIVPAPKEFEAAVAELLVADTMDRYAFDASQQNLKSVF